MKQQLNEVKRLQKIAGILKEYEIKKPENIYVNDEDNSDIDPSSLVGKTINLIKTWHTTDKYNPEKGEMNKVTKDEKISGIIGDSKYEGDPLQGFQLLNDNGKIIGYVMYDEKKDEFVEGSSIYHYVYTGASAKDTAMLNAFKTK